MLLGWYAARNLGDDLMRVAYEHELSDHELTIPFAKPTIEEITAHDILLIGGGNLNAGHMFYKQWPAVIDKLPTDLPIAAHGISLNGMLLPSASCLLNRADYVACRTDDDVSLLESNGIHAERCVDAAYLLDPLSLPRTDELLLIPNWAVSNDKDMWRALLEQHPITVVNFHYPHDSRDSSYLSDVAQGMVTYNGGNLDKIRRVVSEAAATISMRKHGMLLSAIEGMPCLGYVCQNQAPSAIPLAEEAGLDYVMEGESIADLLPRLQNKRPKNIRLQSQAHADIQRLLSISI
jgi:hypothetical protein